MICDSDTFNQNENSEQQLAYFSGHLVPQKASFFSCLEQEVKKILRACQFSKTNGRRNNWMNGMKNNKKTYVLKKRNRPKYLKDKIEHSMKKIIRSSFKQDNKILRRTGQSPNCLANRNWQKLSIHPFINFMRVFRKKAPADCPLNVMRMKAREIWRRMDKEKKYPYLEQALKAKQKGYVN